MDCIISGISLYTRNLVVVLAYCLPDDEQDEKKKSDGQTGSPASGTEPRGGIRRKANSQPPELRLIDLDSQVEMDKDALGLGRYERLTWNDYHLAILPAQKVASVAAAASSRGRLEALAGLGTDMLTVALKPMALFSSGASIRSRDSDVASSPTLSTRPAKTSVQSVHSIQSLHPSLLKPGSKIFIHSPYDCILATKRDLADHLVWLLDRRHYQKAWELVDEHPETLSETLSGEKLPDLRPMSPEKERGSDEFYDDGSSSDMRCSTTVEEKSRIGELWIQQLVEAGDWARAGQVCGRVIKSPDRWKRWVWTFANAKRFDEIVPYIPTEATRPPLPATVYELVLVHYIQTDKLKFRHVLERWPSHLFDINTITVHLENQLKYRDVREESVEDGEVGRDWRIVMDALAKLHEASGRSREALRCYFRLQDADSAMRLIRQGHLASAVADDIPAFISLRLPQDDRKRMRQDELEVATAEAITLLVDEAQHGLVRPDLVVSQLLEKGMNLYIYFYLRGLWKGDGIRQYVGESRARLLSDSQLLVDSFADLTVHLFAMYDQPLLMDFVKSSTAYSFEKAVAECEQRNYIPELVYLYSKTGQMKRALLLIIDRLGDVSRAIAFAKEQDDPDLWEDLLKYSMDKPRFVRALLEEVGTAIDPQTLIRRIPDGLEIEGLRDGLKHIMKEHEIQYSISSGVARVLRSEVAAAQIRLRDGQRRGIKFDVSSRKTPAPAGLGPQTDADKTGDGIASRATTASSVTRPGHCAHCHEAFTEWEDETLVGFACGHVFHLGHVYERMGAGQRLDADLFGGRTEEVEPRPRRTLVAAKVTHARLIRGFICAGCRLCHGEAGGGSVLGQALC